MEVQFDSKPQVADPTTLSADPLRHDAAYAQMMLAVRAVIGETADETADVEVLQISPRGGLVAFSRGGERLVFKLMTCRSRWRKRAARMVGWNPARRAYTQSQSFALRGIPVCPVLEHGAASLPGAPRAVWTISRYIPGADTLRKLKHSLQPERRSAVHPLIVEMSKQALTLLRKVHDEGFQHLDFHAGNLLVVPGNNGSGPSLCLLDLDTVVKRRPFMASRAREICRFIQNFVEPENYREVVMQAIHTYAGDDASLQDRLMKTRPVLRLLQMQGVQSKDLVRARETRAATG